MTELADVDVKRAKLELALDEARRERDAAKSEAKNLQVDLGRALEANDALTSLDGIIPKPRKWARSTSTRKKHRATAFTLASDWHFDEVINPLELVGPTGAPLNSYNRAIAKQRWRRYAEGVCTVARELCSGFDYDGLIVGINGDMVSGNIHEELKETNEASPIETVDVFIDPMCEAISLWADEFGKVDVVGTTGNHGRNTRKPRAKGRVTDNFDWLLNRQVARYFAGDDRVTFKLPATPDVYFEVYGHTHAMTHGDQAKGGSGISGLLTPMSLLDHRKRKRDQAIVNYLGDGRVFSHLWVGHWHTYLTMGNVTVNGSGKGIDEYAFGGNFGFEEPKQAFAVITPENNVTVQAPIYCAGSRKSEGW